MKSWTFECFQQKFSVSNASQGTSERGDPEDELITGDE